MVNTTPFRFSQGWGFRCSCGAQRHCERFEEEKNNSLVGIRTLDHPARRLIFMPTVLGRKCCIYGTSTLLLFSVDKKNQLDVTFCILYFSSNAKHAKT